MMKLAQGVKNRQFDVSTLGYVADAYVPMFELQEDSVKRIDFDSEHMITFLGLIKVSPDHEHWLDFLEGIVKDDMSVWVNAYLGLVLDGGLEYVRL